MRKKATQPNQNNRLWQNDITTLLLRLLAVYVIMAILQVAFYMIDKPYLGHITDLTESWNITKGAMRFNLMSLLIANAPFILLSILPFRFREKRWYQGFLYAIYLITNSAVIIMNSVDIIYFTHTMKRLTLEDTHFASNSNNLPIIFDFIKHNLPVIIIAITLIVLLIYSWHYIKYRPTRIENNRRYYLVNTIAALVVIILSLCGLRGTFNPTKPWTQMSEAAAYSPEKTWLTLSNPYCFFRTLDKESEYDKVRYFNDEECDRIFSPEHSIDSSSIDLGQRNVVVFIMESFSKEHSKYLCPDLYGHEQGCTPFLDSLMQQGYTFTHAYANGMKSIEAMPAVFASIPSFKTSFATMPETFGEFEAMPEILAKQGYETAFFSGSERNSMGFEEMAQKFGVEKCYCREEYESAYPVNDSTIEPFWGVYDMPYFLFMADEIDKMEEPFFASVFNLTSHHPYRVPPDYSEIVPRGHTPEQYVVAYTDLSLRAFFERAKTAPWFNNTVFVFVADHVAPLAYDPQTRSTMKGRSSIIQFLYTPDGALQGTDSTTVQQLDLMPTLLGLLGNKETYYAFGRDVFNEPQRQPVAFNCINQVYQCITDSTTFYFDTENVIEIVEGKPKKEDEDFLKAVLQSYANSLTNKRYTVKE
jgi:phosphoglycerol transferase MdoB-like AlkP superfamily enzyme